MSNKNNDSLTRLAYCYRLLSGCFYLPEKDYFIQEQVFENLYSSLAIECEEAAASCQKMKESFLACPEEELHVEYARLFVGPFEVPAPPYGSIYLEGKGQVMGSSTLETEKMYRQGGLEMAADMHEPADHIAFELEFLSSLAADLSKAHYKNRSETVEALNIRNLYSDFLKNYAGKWAPQFCERIKKNSDNAFYQSLADCLEIFINKQLQTIT